MNYEKRYKEALERARDLMTNQNPPAFDKDLISIVFPELAESEDERIRKELIRIFKGEISYTSKEDTDKYIAWLEKQGEQKAANSSQACTMETLMTLDEAIEHCKEKSCDDTACGKEHKQLAEWLTELKGYRVQGTQNTEPVDKPKFHPGDWVINTDNRLIWEITNIRNSLYYIRDINGNEGYETYDGLQDNYHLWTIADAKDGDILMATTSRNCPFIYRKTNYNNNLAYYYAGINGNGDFCEGCLKRRLYHFGPVANITPATKEQRDLLFRKMKEAGYKWDAKNKCLCTIN